MRNLKDIVEETVGVSPKRHGMSFNCPCPFCMEGEDRFIIWIPTSEKPTGSYHCRVCGRSGDGIEFAKQFLKLSYREACDLFNVEARESVHRIPVVKARRPLYPIVQDPPQLWQQRALAHLAQYKQLLRDSIQARSLIKKRGITLETADQFSIGYNDKDTWEAREAWGLSKENKANGGERKIWLPRGLVVARYSATKALIGLKIRRDEWKEGDKLKKYAEISGSANCMGIYGNSSLEVAVIVESELDAILIQQEAADICFCISLGGAGGKRLDQFTHTKLSQCSLILLSFDDDVAGYAEFQWWKRIFPDAKHWPAPIGKSPGDAHVLGENLHLWIEAALYEYKFTEIPNSQIQG